ncbi:MAG: hypothetical protein QNJ05_06605 [Woeseiaceae bacterium]|nr:hypothetical protein [Woeseiaceae bacterium]
MDILSELILSGRIIDIVLGVLILELLLISMLYRTKGKGVPPYPLLVNIGAGGSLALGIKASVTGADWQWIAVWLVASLVFHILDISARWQRGT